MAYKIIDLGARNGNFSRAAAINDCGQIVGATGNSAYPDTPASPAPFLWAQGVMTLLSLPAPARYGQALALNKFQQVVGSIYNGTADKAVIWTNGSYAQLPFPGDGPAARGISDCGFVVGEGGAPPAGNTQAYSTQNGLIHLQPIPPTPPNVLPTDRYARAYAINNVGQVVGGSDTGTPIPFPKAYAPPVPGIHAVLWENGMVTDLGPLHPGEGSEAYGINDRGQVVGRSGNRAILWNNSAKTDLGPGAALGINNAGTIIGDSFLWRPNGRVTLASLLPPSSDWSNLTGADINDRGEVVGTGTHNGQTRAFLLVP